MARFKKGQKNPKARENGKKGGRPRKEVTEAKRLVERLAADFCKKYLENHLKPIMDAYIASASGRRRGNIRRKFDPATCRHAVERFVGPAPRSLILDLQETVETFFEQVEKMERRDRGEDTGE